MNVSSTPGHRWYSQLANQCVVLLDGVKQHYVLTACEEEGWIEVADINEPSVGGELPVARKSGRVEILLAPQASRLITPNFLRVAEWLTRASKEVGNREHIAVQTGCMLEEVAEFLNELAVEEFDSLDSAVVHLQLLARYLKRGGEMVIANPVKALDALCDIDVTINGVAFLAGWNKCLADLAVLNANDDKFVNGQPVFLPGGKIGKREGWEAPDLTPFVANVETPDAASPSQPH